MAERQWTPGQRDAIEARGGTVLVSAAAGSGKTAVLVERVMGLIRDPEHPVNADRMLVVTFSNAAALEMKQRLMRSLDEALSGAPEDPQLQKQRRLVERAKICTIHAFCLDLIRENFHRLGLSPNTRAGDEKELELLRRECMDQAVEELYREDAGSGFHELIELLSTGRDDRKVFETLRDFYDFVRAHPFCHKWLDEKLSLYDPEIPVSDTAWGRAIFRETQETLLYCADMISEALETIREIPEMKAAYFAAYESDLAKFYDIGQLCEKRDWDAVYGALRSLKRDRLGRLSGDFPEKERVMALRETVYTKIIPKLQKGTPTKEGLICATAGEFAGDVAFLRPLVGRLFGLVKRFDEIFAAAKRRRMIIDFSDMEQFAAQLLAVPVEGGWRPTELARSVGSAYEEILIDEFQDTNEVQEIIFRALSREESNLFMVGDVKQSIYRFRQACPRLFIEKKERFTPYGQGVFPAKIILGKNFRSAPEVTGGINLFFSLFMSREFGDIEYDQGEALDPGLEYPPGPERGCVLQVIDQAGEKGDKTAAEAAHVARQIRELLDGGRQVAQGDSLRPLQYGDICILMRSVKRAKIFREALQREGIPAWSEPKNGFLKSREIAPLVCLLRVLSNPLSDMDMVSVMLSPLYDFTVDELAAIRGAEPGTVYAAVRARAEKGEERCQAFLRSMNELRRCAARSTSDQFLRRVFDETDYLNKVLVMPGGQARRANLLLFVEYARSYRTSCIGVFAFASFLDRLLAAGNDLAPASGFSEQADVVRIMTIHRSKGLEFPVVFLCDCAREFNRGDYIGGIQWNSEMGFACARRDFDTRKQYPTVPLQALKLEQQRASLSEELRMLYVAMTRARELLIMTGVCADFKKGLEGWICRPGMNGKLAPYAMRGAKNYLDWLMMAAVQHPALHPYLEENGLSVVGAAEGPLRFACVPARALEETPACETPMEQPSGETLARLQKILDFSYPWQAQTQIPGKIAASQLGKGDTAKEFRFAARPAFLTGEKLTGAQRGNALHKFMQFADYEAAARDPAAETERLARMGFLSALEAQAVDERKLRDFFESPLAARIFSAEKVLREMRFLAEAGRKEIGDFMELPDDESRLVVQGIADCVFIEDGGAVIVDYKSDRVKTPEELARRYRGQLEIYRRVLGESLGVPVKECVLYSFALSRQITAFSAL